jgi:hypothetical protein
MSPAAVRNRDRVIGFGEPVLPRYERIAFEKSLVAPPGQPPAAFVCPGHPLLNAVIDLMLERGRDLLRRGTILVDERYPGTDPRVLFFLEHAIQDASLTRSGERRVVSKRLLFVEIDAHGAARHLNYAPYLDYRPLAQDEPSADAILARPECAWIGHDLEGKAQAHSVANVVPEHLDEVRDRKLALLDKTEAAVKGPADQGNQLLGLSRRAAKGAGARRQGERAAQLRRGAQARRRASGPLQKRLEEIRRERQLAPLPPVVLGGLLVVPAGLIGAIRGLAAASLRTDTQAAAARAREIVMQVERGLGYLPVDREAEKLGYDIESAVPGTGRLRFIEVKGRMGGAETVTVTKNEILYSLNNPDDFVLAVVEFLGDGRHAVHYVREPFRRKPDFGVTSVNYALRELLARATLPG